MFKVVEGDPSAITKNKRNWNKNRKYQTIMGIIE
jgi:hypothetical protein